MDISTLTTISAVSTSSSTASKNAPPRHTAIARKLQEMQRRTQYARRIIDNEGQLSYGGCTAERVGPPTFLGEETKSKWRRDIRKCANRCVWDYLLPQYLQKLEVYKNKIVNEVAVTVTEENRAEIERGLQLGVDRANRKWDKREGKMRNRRETEREVGVIAMTKLGPHEVEEIGRIRRGEAVVKEDEEIVINTSISQTDNVYRIIAQDIYGSGRLSKIICRNIWKYIHKHEHREKEAFVPFMGRLTNGTVRWISSWTMFCAFLGNRDLVVTTYELEILSRLYDVRVKVFRAGDAGFECTWQSSVSRDREVKLLVNADFKWMGLRKVTKESERSIIEHIGEEVLEDSNRGEGGEEVENNNNKHSYNNNNSREMDKRKEQALENSEGSTDTFIKKLFGEGDSPRSEETNQEKEDVDKIEEVAKSHKERGKGIKIRNERKRLLWQTWRNRIRDTKRNRERKKVEREHKEAIKQRTKQLVFDFTTEGLEEGELEILSKGETFCITNNKVDEDRLKTDIFNFSRRLRLHEEFRDPLANKENENKGPGTTQAQIDNRGTQTTERRSEGSMQRALEGRGTLIRRHTQRRTSRMSVITQTPLQSSNTQRNENRLSSITQTQATRGRVFTGKNVGSNNNIQGSQIARRDTQRPTNRMSRITQTPLETRGAQRNTNRPLRNTQSQAGRGSVNVSNSTGNNNIVRGDSNRVEAGDTQCTIRSNHYSNKVRKPVSLYDPVSQNRNLNRYINCISEETLLITKKKVEFKDNITKQQREAIQSLKKKIAEQKIIITKADKGSGLVVVDYGVYIEKGTKYIEEEAKAYTIVEESSRNIISKLTKKRDSIVQRLKHLGVIEVETATYCIKQLEEKITGLKFYYKIHKDTNIRTMPLRPLQSCINSPTHHLSQVLTDILQPYLQSKYIPTYIQDSNQLLFRLEKLQHLRTIDTLISSDVAALYPSIPHGNGLLAITDFLQQNSSYSEDQIKTVVKALELVITENYVVWNDKVYKQTSGVAMGTPVAVAYANIFMHWIDEEIRERAPFIVEHIRYIDDNLFVIPEEKIEELMQIANNILNPHIRFTYETLEKNAETGLAFLDTQLFIIGEGKIVSRLYTKKTDKHAYLLPSSYHPTHITRNIPLAVFNRIRRICSKDEWFQADAKKASEWLEDREYKQKDIQKALLASSNKDRWTMISKIEEKRGEEAANDNNKKEVYDIPFLVTYGHATQSIRQVLKHRQELLDASFIKTKVKPRLSFRRQNNINDILVQKALRGPITTKEERVFQLCGEKPKYRTMCPCRGAHDQKICRCCAHAKVVMEGVKVKLFKNVNCDTKNIIYLIGCKDCRKRYVGETQQKLKERLLQHLGNIGKLKQPLYTHFATTHKPNQLFITILETVRSEEPAFRKVREAWWINKLQTLDPRGFNVKLDCNQIYEASHSTIMIERQKSSDSRGY